jgi:hypothetical protein
MLGIPLTVIFTHVARKPADNNVFGPLPQKTVGHYCFMKCVMTTETQNKSWQAYAYLDIVLSYSGLQFPVWTEKTKNTTNEFTLTLTLLMWRIGWASNNASKWQIGINSVFKGLIYHFGLLTVHRSA